MYTITRKTNTLSVSPEPPGLHGAIGYMHENYQAEGPEWKSLGATLDNTFVTLPGLFERVSNWMLERKIDFEIIDKRKKPELNLELIDHESQRQAGKILIEGLERNENGIIVGPCGVGKTHVIKAILESIPQGKILITTDDIGAATQLYDDLTGLLPSRKFSIWCSRKKTKPTNIMITTSDSIKAIANNKVFVEAKLSLADYDTWIADEVHTLPTPTVLPLLTKIKAKTRIGLTATPIRKDGAHALIEGYFGPIIANVSHEEGVQLGNVSSVNVCIFPVPFIESECRRLPSDCTDWRVTAFGLVHYRPLHFLIKSIHKLIPKDGGHIIFADWAKYCDILKKQIPGSESLYTRKGPAEVNRIKAGVKSGKISCVITTDLIQKSFNAPSVKYVTMAALGSTAEKIQRAGRATRILENKTSAQVHDFLYLHHPILFLASIKIIKEYENLGWNPKIMMKSSDLVSSIEENKQQLGEYANKLLELEKYCHG